MTTSSTGWSTARKRIAGPFRDELRARTEWQRLTCHDGWRATERYHITVEPRA